MKSTNPFVFIVGCPRSGTTLLRRMVDAHPQIAITPETHWIPLFYRRSEGLTPEKHVTSRLLPLLTAHRRFNDLGVSQKALEQLLEGQEKMTYAEFVTGIFDLYAMSQNKTLAGDKTPGYAVQMKLLHCMWPTAKFIHLIRDGRDVCLSLMNWRKSERMMRHYTQDWHKDSLTTGSLFWKWKVQMGRETGRMLSSELYLELRYETLVNDPAGVMQRVCSFLNLPYSDNMLQFHAGKTRADPGLSANRAWMPVTPGLRDWRTQMQPDQVELFEAAAGDLLADLGYARNFPQPSPETLKQAGAILDSFTKELEERGRAFPLNWQKKADD